MTLWRPSLKFLSSRTSKWLAGSVRYGRGVNAAYRVFLDSVSPTTSNDTQINVLLCYVHDGSSLVWTYHHPRWRLFDPRRQLALLSMDSPTTGVHLQQFLFELQWVKQTIPNFTLIVAGLHQLMEQVYDLTYKRTKRSVSRVLLPHKGCTTSYQTSFKTCEKTLANLHKLSHQDPLQQLRPYTDSSDLPWSVIIIQVQMAVITNPHEGQRHSPLVLLPGSFNATQLVCSVLEKENHAVLNTVYQMEGLL